MNRLIGDGSIRVVTVNPIDGFEGSCRGVRREGFVSSGVDAIDGATIRKILEPLKPKEGEERSSVADVFQSVLNAVTELRAGEAAEALLLDGEPSLASNDWRQAKELAALICRTPAGMASFIALCRQQAVDPLSEHVALLISLQSILRAQRTMSSDQIDHANATILTQQAGAAERNRRAEWRARIATARQFKPN